MYCCVGVSSQCDTLRNVMCVCSVAFVQLLFEFADALTMMFVVNRWHEIVPVDSYIVNLLHLTDPRHATTELSCTAISTAAGAKNKALHTPAASRVGSKVNFALGTAHGESAYSTSPTHYSSAQGLYRGGYSESKTNLSALEEAILPLRENLPRSLSAQEVAIVEKIFPFIVNTAMSSKTLGEIVWMVRVAEEELVQVIEKVPYLQVVKKISV